MKVVSTEKLPEKLKTILIIDSPTSKDLEDADVLIGWPSRINLVIEKCKNLKMIQTFSAGVDNLEFKLIPPHVKIFSNAGSYALPVAEHAWGLILAAAKGVNIKERLTAYQIYGRTLLVVGGGGIGTEVARLGRSFKTFNVGISRSFKDITVFDKTDEITKVKEYVREADIIVDTLPLNLKTKGILNYDLLSGIKKNCIIVNVGRGETVDEDGMFKLLSERNDIRFATDVFWRDAEGKENFYTSKLWKLNNFFATFHTAGAYGNNEVMVNAMSIAIDNVRRFIEGEETRNEVKISDYIEKS